MHCTSSCIEDTRPYKAESMQCTLQFREGVVRVPNVDVESGGRRRWRCRRMLVVEVRQIRQLAVCKWLIELHLQLVKDQEGIGFRKRNDSSKRHKCNTAEQYCSEAAHIRSIRQLNCGPAGGGSSPPTFCLHFQWKAADCA